MNFNRPLFGDHTTANKVADGNRIEEVIQIAAPEDLAAPAVLDPALRTKSIKVIYQN